MMEHFNDKSPYQVGTPLAPFEHPKNGVDGQTFSSN
jgi:hypothetical protein